MLRGLSALYRPDFDSFYGDWRRVLQPVLASAPWCWPGAHDHVANSRALRLVPAGRPRVRVGQVPLVAVHPDGACLVSVQVGDDAPRGMHVVGLSGSALATFRDAIRVTPAALPFLWRRWVPPGGVHGVELRSPETQRGVAALQGESCGLGLLIACASWALGLPPRPDTIATAELVESGGSWRINPVGGLEQKLEVIWRTAPALTRVVVQADQVGEALDVCRQLGAGLEIVPAVTPADVLRGELWEVATTYLHELGTDRERRPQWIDNLLRDMVVEGAGAMTPAWGPVARALAFAIRHWRHRGLDADEQNSLCYMWSCARRHQQNTGANRRVDEAWIARQPRRRQTIIAANLVQQSHDCGVPAAIAARRLGEECLKASPDPTAESHVRLLGALARLERLLGDYDDAFSRQLEAFDLLIRDHPGQTTYQLSEIYLLAALRRREDWLRKGDRVKADTLAALPHASMDFPDLARARAVVCCEIAADTEWAATRLETLWTGVNQRQHVRLSAGRWLARLCHAGHHPSARSIWSALGAPPHPQGRHNRLTGTFAALAAIDEAEAEGRGHDAELALRRLELKQPGIVRPLLQRAPSNMTARFVAHEFPY